MQFKSDALMLSAIDYGENNKILTLFTLDRGKVTASIRGVKKAAAKLKFATEPFCFAEYVFAEKSGRYTVTSCSLIDSFYNLRLDLVKSYAAFAVTEFCNLMLMEESAATQLFILAVNSLKKMCYEDISVRAVLIGFLMEGLKLLGYEIEFDKCIVCGGDLTAPVYFEFEMGGASCAGCAKGRKVSGSTMQVLRAALQKDYAIRSELTDGENRALKLITYFIYEKTGSNLKVAGDLAALNI